MPVSSTATTMLLWPVLMSQAAGALMLDTTSPGTLLGGFRYHWPTLGPLGRAVA